MLEPVAIPVGQAIFEPHGTPRYVHFVTSGMISMVTSMRGGELVEVGLVGREGLAEGLHLLGPELGTKQAFVQIAGTALRMSFRRFDEEFQKDASLRRFVLRFVQYESLVLAQIAACNRLHNVEERLARWLLMVQDRIGEMSIDLTQELLGEMLGTRRSSVTLAAGGFQRSGLIEYRRGTIHIENRERLEQCACECYASITQLFKDLYR
ncbi:MAG: Crp/Fnr family transcriptional regulator [Janthinobacterium lividum]